MSGSEMDRDRILITLLVSGWCVKEAREREFLFCVQEQIRLAGR